MKKKFNINTIALEDITGIKKGRTIREIGYLTICVGLLTVVAGEFISSRSSLKIRAICNEASDLIEELDDIWLEQQNLK